jgi:hypothetical protein
MTRMRLYTGSDANRKVCPARKRCSHNCFTRKPQTPTSPSSFEQWTWGRVSWELAELSGIALRHVRVDRGYQHALDEARDQATQFGIVDERQEVVDHWKEAKSWIVPPVVVDVALLGGGSGYELLVGYTRLGNLLGLLDRQEASEVQKHLVWMGSATDRG